MGYVLNDATLDMVLFRHLSLSVSGAYCIHIIYNVPAVELLIFFIEHFNNNNTMISSFGAQICHSVTLVALQHYYSWSLGHYFIP